MIKTSNLLKIKIIFVFAMASSHLLANQLPQSYAQCAACHGVNGEGKAALNSPAIAGMESWYTKRQLENFQKGKRGASAKDTYGAQMVGIAKLLKAENIQALSTALSKLPKVKPAAAQQGSADAGKKFYLSNCSACHSGNGRGNPNLKAPSLLGMDEAYLTRQIVNFRQDIRGTHQYDVTGRQMAMMAKILPNDAAVADVVAYILTLNN